MGKGQIEFCGFCKHYSPKDSFDEEGEENTMDIGLCCELDHVVWFHTPAEDCNYREPWRSCLRGQPALSTTEWEGC